MKTKEELRLCFEDGDKPTQEHFWAWQDSYWHKNEKIDMNKIAGLENGIPRFNDFHAEIDENGNASLAHLQVRNIFIKPGTLHIPEQFASGMGLSNLFLADSVITIGVDSFNNNIISSLVIPQNVTVIKENAFSFNQLTTLTIPGNVTEIKASAFSYNKLTSLSISAGVSIVGHYAFNNNPDLNTVILDKDTQYYPDSFDANTRVIGGTIINEAK